MLLKAKRHRIDGPSPTQGLLRNPSLRIRTSYHQLHLLVKVLVVVSDRNLATQEKERWFA